MIDDEANDDWMRDWATDRRVWLGAALMAPFAIGGLVWWIVTHPW